MVGLEQQFMESAHYPLLIYPSYELSKANPDIFSVLLPPTLISERTTNHIDSDHQQTKTAMLCAVSVYQTDHLLSFRYELGQRS